MAANTFNNHLTGNSPSSAVCCVDRPMSGSARMLVGLPLRPLSAQLIVNDVMIDEPHERCPDGYETSV